MTEDMAEIARRCIACLDLTDLTDDCDEAAIDALCARAVTPHGTVAAICIWPKFVAYARKQLPADVKIATVVNFPTGAEPAEDVIEMTERAVLDGADEIDMVIPWQELMEGRAQNVLTRVERVKRAAGTAKVKAILETGMLEDHDLIRKASRLALEGGADFIKTSTGKAPVSATLGAAEIMLNVIRDFDRTRGFKPAGGIKTAQDAANYMQLAEQILGEGWAIPANFRLGASSVLDALIAAVEGREAAASEGY
ncbi:deoxyribose-phosphate aldolase [Rhodovulum sp. DZ06]|uniref:deoxyribose-phosphate aldolase n=1 Tax=Rhodovulum sp. DZ06 TaxID=3425126 RepID=UPI003D34A3EF